MSVLYAGEDWERKMEGKKGGMLVEKDKKVGGKDADLVLRN